MEPSDRQWLFSALANWERAAREDLQVAPAPLPTVVAIDGRCSYRLPSGDVGRAIGAPHGGTVTLPGGRQVPLGPISAASDDAGGYFAMSMPSVWRAAGVTSELGLERLMDGVLLHEISHTSQLALASDEFERIAAGAGLDSANWNDDMIQDRFAKNRDYTAAWRAETEALYAAALAPTRDEARDLAATALGMLRARRARWFTGADAYLSDLDDVFLTMEGMGQWLAYRHYLSPVGGNETEAAALKAVRPDRTYWSQEEGLALILVLDRLLPDWRDRVQAAPGWRGERLLAAAVAR